MTTLSRWVAVLLFLCACDDVEDRAETHFQRGLKLAQTGDEKRALIEFKTAVALDASHRVARDNYARLLRGMGMRTKARHQFQRLAEADPGDLDARLALSELAILAQDWNTAERHSRALTASPEAASVALALAFREAVLAQNTVKLRKLTNQAERLAKTKPDDPILSRILIDGHLAAGRIGSAIEVAEALAAEVPHDAAINHVLADLLADSGDLDRLETHLRQMVEAIPAENAALRLVQLVRHLHGDAAALVEVEAQIARVGALPMLTSLKAALLYDSGAPDRAIALLRSADGADGKVMLAQMLDQSGKPTEARQQVDEVLRTDPVHPGALKMRAQWQIASGKTEQAATTLQLVLQLDPEDHEAVGLMAHLRTQSILAKAAGLESTGDIDGAIAIYDTLFEEDPANWLVANNLASLLSTHRTDDASLKRAHTIAMRFQGVDYPSIQDTYGWILYRMGDAEQAVEYLRPAADSLSEDPDVQIRLGKAYAALGRDAEAQSQFQKAALLTGPGQASGALP